MPDLDDILAAIEAGELDGKLDNVATAIVNRVQTGMVRMAWRLRYDGDEWTKETATLGELKFAESVATVTELVAGRAVRRPASMDEINPKGNAEHAVALIVAHLHKAQGAQLADAVKRAEAITKAEFDEMVSEFEVVRPPKDDATSGPSTSTSTTA